MSNVFEIVSHYCVEKRDQTFFDYVKNKRGWSQETIDQWEIGYFPPKSLLDLKIKIASHNLSIRDLENVHVVANWGIKGYQSKFFGRIIFPIKNEFGEYISITGRAIDGVSEPKYYNTDFEKGNHLYGLDQAIDTIREKDIVYVFEGNADVVTAHQSGVKNAVCVMGTALREDHLIVLSGYTKNIVMVFDNDKGGKDALASFNEKMFYENSKKITIFRSTFHGYQPFCKDADDFITKNGGKVFVDFIDKSIKDMSVQNKLKGIKKKKGGDIWPKDTCQTRNMNNSSSSGNTTL